MLSAGADVFVQLPPYQPERNLHPGRVAQANGTQFVASLSPELPLEVGQELQIYYQLNRCFVKQLIQVNAVLGPDTSESEHVRQLFTMEKISEPQMADGRQNLRMSDALANITIAFGDQEDCPLADVSQSGFAVISKVEHPENSKVLATFTYDGQQHTGEVDIQSKRELATGGFRYGVFCLDDHLEPVIRHINMKIQREELQRLAGKEGRSSDLSPV